MLTFCSLKQFCSDSAETQWQSLQYSPSWTHWLAKLNSVDTSHTQPEPTPSIRTSATHSPCTASKRTKQLEEELLCRDGSVEYWQAVSVDNAESSTNFHDCTTQTCIAVEIRQQQHCNRHTRWHATWTRKHSDSSYIHAISTAIHTKPFNSPLSGTTRVSQYQKKHSPTHTYEEEEEGFAQTRSLS